VPDVDSMLNALGRLRTQPFADPSPHEQVARRSARIRRRRQVTMSLGCALLVGLGAVALESQLGESSDGVVATDVAAGTPAGTPAAATPAAYLDDVIDHIEADGYFATPAEVETWREQAVEVAAGASVPADTYGFVHQMMDALNVRYPGHTLWRSDRASAYESVVPTPLDGLPPSQVDGGIGYIAMTSVDADPTSDDGRQYIDHVQSALSAPACGWIVDLRTPSPSPSRTETMVAAVTPLLPEGPALGYRHGDGSGTGLTVEPGGSLSSTDQLIDATTAGAGAALDGPVAILQGPLSAGAYESVLIAFGGRAGARTFGEPSGGQSFDVMESFPLSDGSLLWLTTQLPVDHTGEVVQGPVEPDVAVPAGESEGNDPARAAATTWLEEQGACQ